MSKPDERIAELCPNGVEHKTLDLGQVSYGNTDHLAQNERKDCAIIDDELRAIKNLFSELEKGEVSAGKDGWISLEEAEKEIRYMIRLF